MTTAAARSKSAAGGGKAGGTSTGPAAKSSQAEESGGQAQVVKRLLKKMEAKLTKADAKASLGDYIRLVQLQKELDEEAPKEIKVTWVEPSASETEEGGS